MRRLNFGADSASKPLFPTFKSPFWEPGRFPNANLFALLASYLVWTPIGEIKMPINKKTQLLTEPGQS